MLLAERPLAAGSMFGWLNSSWRRSTIGARRPRCSSHSSSKLPSPNSLHSCAFRGECGIAGRIIASITPIMREALHPSGAGRPAERVHGGERI
jgi:hypothetical protein